MGNHRSTRAALAVALAVYSVGFATTALAGAEEVLLYKVLGAGDEGIIVRQNGDAYQIQKGVGCLGFGLREGRTILIVSPGLFLGVGSKLLIPERDQECRIWNSTALGNFGGKSPPANPPSPSSPGISKRSASADPIAVTAAQAALTLLGYEPGPIDGQPGESTSRALKEFQKKQALPQSGQLDNSTRVALSTELTKRYPAEDRVLVIVGALLGATPLSSSPGPSGCEEGHWVQSVADGGTIVILENGSVWEVDIVNQIDTALWLPTEDIILCAGSMINTDNGEKVGVTRLR